MKLTDEEIKEGVRLCLDNARKLLEEAELLLVNASAGHALLGYLCYRENKQSLHICRCNYTHEDFSKVVEHENREHGGKKE